MTTTVADLRNNILRVIDAAHTVNRSEEQTTDDVLVALGDWLLDRIAAEMAKPKHNGRCPCGRATLVSERSGRITAYGMIYDEIVLLTEGKAS